MKNLTAELSRFLIYKISDFFEKINSFYNIKIEDENNKEYNIKISSGKYFSNEDVLQLLYTKIDDFTYLLFFKKNTNNWYCINYNANDISYILKIINEKWINCSMKEQLRIVLSFEEIFDSGAILSESDQKIDEKLILEVLEYEFF